MNEEVMQFIGKALINDVSEIEYLRKEVDQLTNNWNELEEWVKNKFSYYSDNTCELDEDTILYCLHRKDVYREVLDKMKEIKEGNNVSSRD